MKGYETLSLAGLLEENSYPGRGIVLGMTPDGVCSVAVYFIMGRSVNSRNRIFVEEPDGIRTEAFDPAKLSDPSLIIYHPVREAGRGLVVTNGDQTDTICEFLLRGQSFAAALRTREFEPDAPNFTPRISGCSLPTAATSSRFSRQTTRRASTARVSFLNTPATPAQATCCTPMCATARPSQVLQASRSASPFPATSTPSPTRCGTA